MVGILRDAGVDEGDARSWFENKFDQYPDGYVNMDARFSFAYSWSYKRNTNYCGHIINNTIKGDVGMLQCPHVATIKDIEDINVQCRKVCSPSDSYFAGPHDLIARQLRKLQPTSAAAAVDIVAIVIPEEERSLNSDDEVEDEEIKHEEEREQDEEEMMNNKGDELLIQVDEILQGDQVFRGDEVLQGDQVFRVLQGDNIIHNNVDVHNQSSESGGNGPETNTNAT